MKTNASQLLETLSQHPRATTAELCRLLGNINRSTLMRLLPQVSEQVVRLGSTRRSRYSLRRALRGSQTPIPLYQIDQNGDGEHIADLSLTYPAGSVLTSHAHIPWPLDIDMQDGWYEGLPYFLSDMAPAGFLGRNFAHTYSKELHVDENPGNWSDDDIAFVLSSFGADQPGNSILGNKAYGRYLETRRDAEKNLITETQLSQEYPSLADRAMSHGVAGSSAAGEFPKFTATRWNNNTPISVIVKFSGADGSAAVQRWSDLLVCEHLALETLGTHTDIVVAQSRIHRFVGRTFLEVERFDRTGLYGRLPTCTLSSLADSLIGQRADWPVLIEELVKNDWLASDQATIVKTAWLFGRLIANSDMHEGNISFRPGLTLAPIYDMLPMQYAPARGGELAPQNYSPPLPYPQEVDAWRVAAHAALAFWNAAQNDARISPAFQQICAENHDALMAAYETTYGTSYDRITPSSRGQKLLL